MDQSLPGWRNLPSCADQHHQNLNLPSHKSIGQQAFIIMSCMIGLFAILFSITEPVLRPVENMTLRQQANSIAAKSTGWNVSKASFSFKIRPFSPEIYDLNAYGDGE